MGPDVEPDRGVPIAQRLGNIGNRTRPFLCTAHFHGGCSLLYLHSGQRSYVAHQVLRSFPSRLKALVVIHGQPAAQRC